MSAHDPPGLSHEYGVMWSDHGPDADTIDGPYRSSRVARAFAREAITAGDLTAEYAIMRRIPGDDRWTDFQGRLAPDAFAARWAPPSADRTTDTPKDH